MQYTRPVLWKFFTFYDLKYKETHSGLFLGQHDLSLVSNTTKGQLLHSDYFLCFLCDFGLLFSPTVVPGCFFANSLVTYRPVPASLYFVILNSIFIRSNRSIANSVRKRRFGEKEAVLLAPLILVCKLKPLLDIRD